MSPVVGTGPRNLITDVAGLAVGQTEDKQLISGVTAIVCETPSVASVDVRGGGPGTRETDLLAPEMTVEAIDAVVISGGSAFGLDAASGAQAWLRVQGRGFAVGQARVAIVPSAVLFDLSDGDIEWGRYPPYRELAYAACESAGMEFALGSAGAGTGATTSNYRGGVGSASQVTSAGFTVGALAAVNAVGGATMGDGPHFWAGAWEMGREFGGHGMPARADEAALGVRSKLDALASTTPAVVATDAALTKPQARRLAVMAQDGMARALHPVHTPLDGDVVFAIATGRRPLADPVRDMMELGAAAARCLARAIARGVFEAGRGGAGVARLPAYRDRFPPP